MRKPTYAELIASDVRNAVQALLEEKGYIKPKTESIELLGNLESGLDEFESDVAAWFNKANGN